MLSAQTTFLLAPLSEVLEIAVLFGFTFGSATAMLLTKVLLFPHRIRDLASPRAGVRGVLIVVVGGVVRDGDVVAIVDLDSLAAVPVDQVALYQGRVGVVRVPAGLRALEVVDDDAVAVAVRAGLGDVVVAGVVGDDGSVARGGGVAGDVAVLPDRDAGVTVAGARIVVGRVAFDGLELGMNERDPVSGRCRGRCC